MSSEGNREKPIELIFTGDIMAHEVNYSMRDYSRIYENVEPVLHSGDLCFGNLEVPVADSLPLSTYPRFNVHSPYLRAAIDAGFNVFSLANNHSNDQGVSGILATRSLLESLGPTIGSSGLRATEGESMRPTILRAGDTEIVFLSITEILNSHDPSAGLVYFVPPTKAARAAFLADVRRIRGDNPRALFVLAIHLDEPEYVRTVKRAKREWFRELASAGVDIVWGSHPHVMQEWEIATVERDRARRQVLFMYSMGNFISGQRKEINRASPEAFREYTGDGVVLRVTVRSNHIEAIPFPVTVYVDPEAGPIMMPFDASFVASLDEPLQDYYCARYALMRAYLPLPPMPVRAILEQ
jgi:poly-gamma-glutamate synthesis protein (capsule biosynthesis protein)